MRRQNPSLAPRRVVLTQGTPPPPPRGGPPRGAPRCRQSPPTPLSSEPPLWHEAPATPLRAFPRPSALSAPAARAGLISQITSRKAPRPPLPSDLPGPDRLSAPAARAHPGAIHAPSPSLSRRDLQEPSLGGCTSAGDTSMPAYPERPRATAWIHPTPPQQTLPRGFNPPTSARPPARPPRSAEEPTQLLRQPSRGCCRPADNRPPLRALVLLNLNLNSPRNTHERRKPDTFPVLRAGPSGGANFAHIFIFMFFFSL